MEDNYFEFSSINHQLMEKIPEDQNNDDIQDLSNFPRDSFVDHTPYNYIAHNSSSPFSSTQTTLIKNSNNSSINSNEHEFEQGQSGYTSSNLYLYKNTWKNNKQQKLENNYNINKPEVEPIPMDTIIDEEQNLENDNNNSLDNEYSNKIENTNMDNENTDNYMHSDYNIPNIKNKKDYNLDKLYSICKKHGTPPPDGDFSLEGWKLFYPPDEKFFLWEKGKTIKDQILVNNENDEENLEIYEGEINNNGEKHGFGILTTPRYVRKGTWRDGEFTGWCRESRINGDIFEGKFIDGEIYGKGINKTHKGNLYIGDFVDSKREGKGKLKTKRIQYEGEFKYDRFNGKGSLVFLKEGHSYKGEFKNNEISGKGIFKWSNGDIYEGHMTNGKMNGYGKYIYSNGQIYEGNYSNGVKEGFGKLIYPNNKIYEGEFKNGKPYGDQITITDNGKKVILYYENGKFHKKNN